MSIAWKKVTYLLQGAELAFLLLCKLNFDFLFSSVQVRYGRQGMFSFAYILYESTYNTCLSQTIRSHIHLCLRETGWMLKRENNLRSNRGFCFKAVFALLNFTKNSCRLMLFLSNYSSSLNVQRLSSDSTRLWLTGECLLTDTESADEESCKLKQITYFLETKIQ